MIEWQIAGIDKVMVNHEFAGSSVLQNVRDDIALHGSRLHFSGLCLDGGTDSVMRHLHGILQLPENAGFMDICMGLPGHGRDAAKISVV
jgi:bisphosphoglycerate-independent phosphoglycerate mutase (AlkP superfamily)